MSSTAAEFCAFSEMSRPIRRMSSLSEKKVLSSDAVSASILSPCATLESRVLPTAPSQRSRLSVQNLRLSFSDTTFSRVLFTFAEMSAWAS